VTVGGNDVDVDGSQRTAKVMKFVVAMDVNDVETADSIKMDDTTKFF
jgi:hypothetical protein